MWLIYIVLLAVIAFFLYRYISARTASSSDTDEPVNVHPGGAGEPGSTAEHDVLDATIRRRADAYGVGTGDGRRDIRETIKILNLRESDAPRLGIEASTFTALATGNDPHLPAAELERIEARLYRMLS